MRLTIVNTKPLAGGRTNHISGTSTPMPIRSTQPLGTENTIGKQWRLSIAGSHLQVALVLRRNTSSVRNADGNGALEMISNRVKIVNFSLQIPMLCMSIAGRSKTWTPLSGVSQDSKGAQLPREYRYVHSMNPSAPVAI